MRRIRISSKKRRPAARRSIGVAAVSLVMVALMGAPAFACGGLVAPNGTINLLKTTTLSAYVNGIEHYVTSFEFAGGGGKFGSIVPLPGIPSNVKRGGDWTLQRLVQEISPPAPQAFALADAAGGSLRTAKVIQEYTIEALDITILKGGGDEVGLWAKNNGFALPPDAPEVLDFYASRSPIFMAAKFDASRAQELGQQVGDGTPIHVTIPTPTPWVPLRILGLGRQSSEVVEADVFLLTENNPAMLPAPLDPKLFPDRIGDRPTEVGMTLERSEPANGLLLSDLRNDKGMKWLPTDGMWFTYLKINSRAENLDHDLAIDVTGQNTPSLVAAGLQDPESPFVPKSTTPMLAWLVAGFVCFGVLVVSGKMLGNS
jgi:Uncharacterized protein conserved in bacteria (DUF2330)